MNKITLLRTSFPELKLDKLKKVRYKDKTFENYYVTQSGRIFSTYFKNPREILGSKTKTGYCQIQLYHDGINTPAYFHRIVYETFIGLIPPNKEINHIDGNKSNNNVKNLEAISHQENIQHAYDNDLAYQYTGEENPNNKYTDEQAIQVYSLLKNKKLGYSEIAKLVGVPKSFVRVIASGYRSDVTGFNPNEIRRRKRWQKKDNLIVWFLYYVYGWSLKKIGKLFEVSGSSVSNNLKRLMKHKTELDTAIAQKPIQEKIKKFLNENT